MNKLSNEHLLIVIVINAIFFSGLYAYYRSIKKEKKRLDNLTDSERTREILKLSADMGKYNTSHFIHFFLTLFTGGLWFFVWILCALNNSSMRNRIRKQIKKI